MYRTADTMQVAMPGDAKARNRRLMLGIVATGEIVTAAKIHQETGISRQTVMRFLQHCCQRGVIQSMGFGPSTSAGGKKPELFRFCDERKILCVNLWPQTITLGLSGMTGPVYAVQEFAHPLGSDLDANLLDIRSAAETYLAAQGLTLGALYGVVLTVPGTVDYGTNRLRYNSQAPQWATDMDLAQKLRDTLGEHLLCYVDNAGKAAGRALFIERPEYAESRLMTLFTTWGVSACLIDKGHVLNGRDALIGEIGHMTISDTDDAVCGCGKKGCLEIMVGVQRVRRMLREMGGEDADTATIPALFERSASGDAHAQTISRYLAHCFAVALQNMALAYNQETVVFQGDFAHADEIFDRTLKEELRQFRYFPRGEIFTIAYDRRDLALLALQGAAGKLIDKYFDMLAEE